MSNVEKVLEVRISSYGAYIYIESLGRNILQYYRSFHMFVLCFLHCSLYNNINKIILNNSWNNNITTLDVVHCAYYEWNAFFLYSLTL